MPKLQTEMIEYHGDVRERQALILDNGAKLIKLTATREMSVIFLYSDAKYSFQFLAYRWSEDIEVLDTWTVLLGMAIRNLFASPQHQLADTELREIKSNIAAALHAWPTFKLEAAVPLKGVFFHMKDWHDHPDEMIKI